VSSVMLNATIKFWALATAPLTLDQQSFTILSVAADYNEAMVPQRIMWPSIARHNGQLDPQCS